MIDIMQQINTQMEMLPKWVQHWMNWMFFIQVGAVLFIFKYTLARWILAATFIVMGLAAIQFYFFPDVHLFGVPHLVVWGPLLYLIYRQVKAGIKLTSFFGIWLILLSSTFSLSIFFDIRDLVLVWLGLK